MLFMVIEHLKNTVEIGRRFRREGRMLPEGVAYHASWIDPSGPRCFQVMEAPTIDDLRPWTTAWDDLIDFEIVPIVTSAEFWVKEPSVE
jgi:hypothetical protein